MNKPRVLVIIPAYNESECICGVVESLRECCPEYDLVVINDCSTDDTRKVLDNCGARRVDLPSNLGIGGAVQTGYRYALECGYDISVQFDGDGQHMAEFLPAIVDPVARGECDMCVGSRFLEKKGFQTSGLRRFGINFLRVLLRVVCGVKVTDVTSGFRACSRELTEFFSLNYAQDYPEPEAIMEEVTAGFTVQEAPVEMRERTTGKSSISPLKSVYFMIKVSIAIVIGRFTLGGKRNGR
ncbi:MAG: glycosyltransferase family 2 protein [Oscillospiraceae bacterium]